MEKRKMTLKERLAGYGLAASMTGLLFTVMRMESAAITGGTVLLAIGCLAVMAVCAYPLRYRPKRQEHITAATHTAASDRAA